MKPKRIVNMFCQIIEILHDFFKITVEMEPILIPPVNAGNIPFWLSLCAKYDC